MTQELGNLVGFEATIRPVANCKVSEERLQEIAKSLINTPFRDEDQKIIGTIIEAKLIDASKSIFKIKVKMNPQ